MKNDKYRRARGGKSQMIDVICADCGARVLYYQKDGPGWLKRCYLNRIFAPDKWQKLQSEAKVRIKSDLLNLNCDCGSLIGTPMRHTDGRLAFKLVPGSFKRKKSKGNS